MRSCQTHLGKRPVLVAFWDKRGLLRSPGLFQSLVPVSAALGGASCICNTSTLCFSLRAQMFSQEARCRGHASKQGEAPPCWSPNNGS